MFHLGKVTVYHTIRSYMEQFLKGKIAEYAAIVTV